MKRHVAKVHEEKPFNCRMCSTSFVNKIALNQHIDSVHEGKKPFQCEICNAGFARKADCKRHVSKFHEGKKPFK